MRPNRALPCWTACVLIAGIVASLAGCASTGSSTVIPVTDVKSLAGKWAGIADGSGSGQQDYVEMTIREDGTYDVTTSRTIGRYRGTGKIALRDGQLALQGSEAAGVASLMSGSGGERILAIDVKMAGSGGVPNNVRARLRPAR
jgi:hypothetical protein